MMQSRQQSFIEACANVAVGYLVALLSQLIVFPLVGVQASIGQNLTIGAFFTAISLARSYLIRRFFNRKVATA
jgi:hypothetical protein